MVKAEIRPPSSSAPELLASAIKHQAEEGAVEQGLPIMELAPCRAWCCPGPQLPDALVSLAGDVIFPHLAKLGSISRFSWFPHSKNVLFSNTYTIP